MKSRIWIDSIPTYTFTFQLKLHIKHQFEFLMFKLVSKSVYLSLSFYTSLLTISWIYHVGLCDDVPKWLPTHGFLWRHWAQHKRIRYACHHRGETMNNTSEFIMCQAIMSQISILCWEFDGMSHFHSYIKPFCAHWLPRNYEFFSKRKWLSHPKFSVLSLYSLACCVILST